MKAYIVAVIAALGLAGCASTASLSPRETTVDVIAKYAVVQEVAASTIESGLLGEKATNAIKRADLVAVAAIEQYATATRGCERDKDGKIKLIEGLNCEPDKAKASLDVAAQALLTIQGQLTAAQENKDG